MVILQAPVPAIQTTTVLPNPRLNDSEAQTHTVEAPKFALDGTMYGHVKSNTRSKLQYIFQLHRLKALELRAFVSSYYRATIRLTNHKGEVWQVKLVSNPFEFETASRGEFVEIVLECEGILESAPAIPPC